MTRALHVPVTALLGTSMFFSGVTYAATQPVPGWKVGEGATPTHLVEPHQRGRRSKGVGPECHPLNNLSLSNQTGYG